MKKWLHRVLLIFFFITFCVSAGLLTDYFVQSKKQERQYDELSALVEQAREETVSQESQAPSSSEDPIQGIPFVPSQPTHVSVTHPKTGETLKILPEYVAIFLKNPDLVGWITIEDTEINYPVMQTPDFENYYLVRNFNKEASAHGCIYAVETADITKPSDNITIYGHNMKDGSMFAPLHKYAKKAFWEKHPVIRFDTLTQHHTYEILSVFRTTASVGEGFTYHEFVDAENADDFARFVKNCKALSFYDTGVDASYGDKLITLSTCENSQVNGRLVVVAKQVS